MNLLKTSIFLLVIGFCGCEKPPRITVAKAIVGPFTVETITETGKIQNADKGFAEYANISYAVKYKNDPVEISHEIETNTGLPGIWRVFYLRESPKPALIVGSQSFYLITLEDETPKVTTLHEQRESFGSVQWLDSEDGQPGLLRMIYSSDERDTDLDLVGGRFLAISNAIVFDTKTFDVFPFYSINDPVEGYRIALPRAIAFSPDATQVVYLGSNGAKPDSVKPDLSLIVFEFTTGIEYAAPIDRANMNVIDSSRLYADWVDDYFEWRKTSEGLRLQSKGRKSQPLHRGIIHFSRFPGYVYVLSPVDTSMVDHLYEFIIHDLRVDTANIEIRKDSLSKQIIMPYQGRNFILEYGHPKNDLIFYEEGGSTKFETNKRIIERVGKGFNYLLRQGKYQKEFK